MSESKQIEFERFLNAQDERAWTLALDELAPSLHEVDRHATRIWFAFFPLPLARALQTADDPERLAQRLLLQGKYRLEDQIDTSHRFLYGHRFWPEVKAALVERAEAFAGAAALAAEVREVARRAAARVKADESLFVGISAVALMTVAQVGLEKFKSSPGEVRVEGRFARASAEEVLRGRASYNSQGLFAFLRTTDKRWTVVWDESDPTARFQMMHRQEVASAAATDRRDWSQLDPRCTIGEGPIPVQCRSASCGTCWVGVLSGSKKLSPVSARERKAMRQFGYIDTDDPRPLIRLSCQAQGEGAISVVIPPWNGVFGKYLRGRSSNEEGEAAATAAVGE